MPIPKYISSATAATTAAQKSSATTAAQTSAAAAASTARQQQTALSTYGPEVVAALNSGDYSTAWKDAISSESAYGGSQNVNTAATDPLIAALESGAGLHAIDPTLKMSASQIGQYYDAFSQQTGTNAHGAGGTGFSGNLVGKDPYGLWGTAADTTAGVNAQAAVNAKLEPGIADISNYLGARPTQSFLSKYGATIGALAATALSFGVAAPALAGTLAADGLSTLAAGAVAGGVAGGVNTLAVDAITGKPITAGGVLSGALGGAAGGGLTKLASGAINDATGLGSTISTGVAGAGIGAGRAALTGGNIGLGAAAGGIGGAIQGSGLVTGPVGNAAANYAVGGAMGALAGASVGNQNGATTSGASVGNQNGATTSGATAGSTTGTALPGFISGSNSGTAVPVSPQTLSQGANSGSQNSSGSNFFSAGLASTMLNGGQMMGSGVNSTSGLTGNGSNYLGTGGGQGNNGNMASTDTTLAGTIAGALPGVLQGAAGVYGAQNAAQAMTTADANAIGTQQSTLGNINNIWGTQQQLGLGAQTSLGSALGTNGQPANYSGFENMPGYQFAVQQGTQAIQRQAASMGNAYTPNTAAAVGQYVTGTAMSDYNTYINQLMGAAGLGSTANAGIAAPTYQTGANISTLQQNQGYAQASGVTNASNAVGGLLGPNGAVGSLLGAGANYLTGSNSGGGVGAFAPGAGAATNFGGTNTPSFTGVSSPNVSGTDISNMTGASNPVGNTGLGGVNDTTGMTTPAANYLSGTQMPTVDTSGMSSTDFGGGANYGAGSSGSILDSLNNNNFNAAANSGIPSYFNFAGTG